MSLPASTDKNTIVQKMLPLVKRIAYYLAMRLPPSVQVDDLIQAGLIGLMSAIENYQEDHGAQFETYATQRVRGAMLDELRAMDWLPRQVRQNGRKIEGAIDSLEQALGRHPKEAEIAERLGVPLDQYQHMLEESSGGQLLYFEDFQTGEYESLMNVPSLQQTLTPLDVLENENFRAALIDRINDLPERERMVISLYYDQEMNLKEIGAVLEVSESRVCQLHHQAVARLRTRMTEWIHNTASDDKKTRRRKSTSAGGATGGTIPPAATPKAPVAKGS
jgi:RNA polymerase sigma factor FliA